MDVLSVFRCWSLRSLLRCSRGTPELSRFQISRGLGWKFGKGSKPSIRFVRGLDLIEKDACRFVIDMPQVISDVLITHGEAWLDPRLSGIFIVSASSETRRSTQREGDQTGSGL